MPIHYMKSLSKRLNKSEKELEKLWDKAKNLVKKQYPELKVGSDSYYAAVMGVFKRMSGVSLPQEGVNDLDVSIRVYECRQRIHFRTRS